MARFWTEAPHRHGSTARTGILLVNLGTPVAPTAAALRPYLRQFLSDPRVVEIPRAVWLPLLNGVILNTRPRKSAAKYASIWTDEGSPLAVHTRRQAELIAARFASRDDVRVDWAMRYGAPAVADKLGALRAAGCTRILVVPMYPQYAASTTASVMDEVARCLLHWRNLPELRFVRSFHDDPGYIGALAASVREHWTRHGQPDRLLMSFHGLPRYTLERGDPYHCECHRTARLLAESLGLAPERVIVSFQSRFGRTRWLEPYTQPTLEALARDGVGRVDVMCPGFVADCLETLEEIAMECRAAFLGAGGREFHYIPCLNERPDWIDALERRVRSEAGNWLTATPPTDAEREAARGRALALGAAE